ncbi:hypothetical protein L209DRAFT_254615 [Thermothelomyces heterothallicus CBS 203.75]
MHLHGRVTGSFRWYRHSSELTTRVRVYTSPALLHWTKLLSARPPQLHSQQYRGPLYNPSRGTRLDLMRPAPCLANFLIGMMACLSSATLRSGWKEYSTVLDWLVCWSPWLSSLDHVLKCSLGRYFVLVCNYLNEGTLVLLRTRERKAATTVCRPDGRRAEHLLCNQIEAQTTVKEGSYCV